MTNNKANGDTCERIGFARESGANPSSSFLVLRSSLNKSTTKAGLSARARSNTSTGYSAATLAKLSGKSLGACKCAIDEGRVGYVELCSEKKIITVVPEDEAVLFCAQFAPARRVDMLAELLAGEPRAVLEAVFSAKARGGKK